jgi:hypothetical protein
MKENSCCETGTGTSPSGIQIQPALPQNTEDEVCCGPPAGPPSSPFERPGYQICGFVENFIESTSGRIPRIKSALSISDMAGTVMTRIGINRNNYRVAPGLYGIGNPDPDSPVLVTANYKLSFDKVRKELKYTDAWLLVLDTRGINVWCAAGKGTFGTEEVVRSVKAAGLDTVVSHRNLILPQLGATGVSARQVKKECGFQVVWGPILAADIGKFLDSGMKADQTMRRVTFTTMERLVLIPVEISIGLKPMLWIVIVVFILSGIGPDLFSLKAAWTRSLMAAAALAGGVFAGAVLTPAFLPKIPGRAFYIKGAITGFLTAAGILLWYRQDAGLLELSALLLFTMAVSSFMAMNFTGATPFTSPTGVEKEMRRAIPMQIAAVFLAVFAWIGAGF